MKLFNLVVLEKFLSKHRTAKKGLCTWRAWIEHSRWTCLGDVREQFPKIRRINSHRLVFKIGDRWRIDVYINFAAQAVFIVRIGTHEEYNKWKFNE